MMSRDDPRYERWIALVAAEILEHGTDKEGSERIADEYIKETAEYVARCKIALEDYPGCFIPIRDPNEEVQRDHYIAAANHEWCSNE